MLKKVFSATDLNIVIDHAGWVLQDNSEKFKDILRNIDHWDTIKQMNRVTEGREV